MVYRPPKDVAILRIEAGHLCRWCRQAKARGLAFGVLAHHKVFCSTNCACDYAVWKALEEELKASEA